MRLCYVSTATQTDPLDLRVSTANIILSLLSMLGAEKLDLICLGFVNLQLIMMLEFNWMETGRGWPSFPNRMRPYHLGLTGVLNLSGHVKVMEIQMSQKHLKLFSGPVRT